MRHADRGAATASTGPVERTERLERASAARAQRDRDIGFLVICLGLAIFLIPFVVVLVLWSTGAVTSELAGLVFLPAWFASTWVIKRERGVPPPAGGSSRDVALQGLAREFKIMWGPRWARYTAYIGGSIAVIDVVHYYGRDLVS